MPINEVKLSPDFALVFRALPGLYLLLSPGLKVLDATELYARTSRFEIENALGKHILDTFPDNPDKSDEAAKQDLMTSLNHVLASKQPHTMPVVRFDVPLPATQGGGFERRYWSTTHTPILDAAGKLTYILHETRDVTATVLQEEENQQNRERLALLTDTFNAVTWEYDIARNQVTWGDKLQQVLGYQPKEIGLGKDSWQSRVHPEDVPTVEQGLQKAIAAGDKAWSNEYRFRKADGTYIQVLDQGYIVYNDQHIPVRLVGAIIDLTANKQSEENLKESNARFWHVLEKLPHMAWMADAKGRLIYFNENWYDYTGLPQGQVHSWTTAIHPEDSVNVLATWADATNHGHVFEQEYRIRNQLDGQYRWFLDKGVPMYDERGNVKIWIGTYTDIDEQREALAQVQLKDQQLENILSLSPAHHCLLVGSNHICRFVTPGVYKMYGNRQYLGKPAREIWPDLQHLCLTELLDKVYQQQEPVSVQEFCIPFSRRYGDPQEEAYFNLQFQPVLDHNRHMEGILISAVEVTELVQCKQKMPPPNAAG